MNGITFRNRKASVVIEIGGRAFGTLQKIAEVFSKWDNERNTPADIVRRFNIGEMIATINANGGNGDQSFAGMLVDQFSQFPDHTKLEAMLRAARVPVYR